MEGLYRHGHVTHSINKRQINRLERLGSFNNAPSVSGSVTPATRARPRSLSHTAVRTRCNTHTHTVWPLNSPSTACHLPNWKMSLTASLVASTRLSYYALGNSV